MQYLSTVFKRQYGLQRETLPLNDARFSITLTWQILFQLTLYPINCKKFFILHKFVSFVNSLNITA